MSVKEVLQALGSWELSLSEQIPRDLLDTLDFFGHVAVVPGRMDPVQYGDNLLSAARYVGVLRERDLGDGYKISGTGLAFWLGDEDGKGAVYETAVTLTSQTFANSVRALLPASGAVTEGTLHSVAGTYSGAHQFEDPRKALTYVCSMFTTSSDDPVEWRVNNDGTLDAGKVSDLYQFTPTCVIASTASGYDMDLTALSGTFGYQKDVEDFTTRVVLLAEGTGSSIALGDADIVSNPYKDLHGNAVKLTRLVSESTTATGNADSRAQLQLNRFTSARDALTLAASDYDIRGSFRVGDYVWVYDPDCGLVNTSNEIVFRGQRINPAAIRVSETQWPVTAGHTVAYRDLNGTWYDLTDYVEFESPGNTSITVGGISRSLTSSGTEPVGSRPTEDSSVPGVPTFVTPFLGSAYLDNRGFTRSRIVLSWNAPLNVDGSTILDGDHYEIRYAVDTDMIYPATWAQVSMVRWQDLQIWAQPFAAPTGEWQTMVVGWDQTSAQLLDLSPGIGYDIQIRAVDKTGHTGAWSPTTTFVATSDNIPPSTPAAPSVAGSRIALQVTHQLGKETGGTFNLESDLHHLEIHVEYEPYFTPTTSTLKGKVSATAGMIQAQIPVVSTVQVDEVTTRYVRVVAVDISGNKSAPSAAASATAQLIDDAHISDLTVSKVTAGTIAADWIVGARIKTADTGPRVELNSGGIGAWNAAGTQTVSIASSTGDVAIVGQLKSGTSGHRLEINPTSTLLPEIRFYANSGTDYGFVNGVSSGTDVALGSNSSPYLDGGVTKSARCYLTTTGALLEVIRTDTQVRAGAYVWAQNGSLTAGYNSGGTDGGMLYADSTQTIVSAPDYVKVGAVRGGGEDAYWDFLYSDGSLRATGEMGYWGSSTDALIMDRWDVSGSSSGLILSYPATMVSTPWPIAQLYDSSKNSSNALAVNVTARSTTGYTLSFSGNTGSVWSMHTWAWRTN